MTAARCLHTRSTDAPQKKEEHIGADDWAVVDAVVRRSGTSFYWAIRMLPPEKRRAMFAIYAFCRDVDDIADEPAELSLKLKRLQDWRTEIDRAYHGTPQNAIARALVAPINRFDLKEADFLAIIDGMEMDAVPRLRIADSDELALYCDRVACAVGRLSNAVFGAEKADSDRLAATLGTALQLTNILRDLGEDALRDRLYLPADMLHAIGVHETHDAVATLEHPDLPRVCDRLAEKAHGLFLEATEILANSDRRRMRAARIMLEVYRRTFDRLIARGWKNWAEPVSISKAEKLWVAVRYGLI